MKHLNNSVLASIVLANLSIAIASAAHRHATLRRAKSDAQLLSISTTGEKCVEKLHNYGRFW